MIVSSFQTQDPRAPQTIQWGFVEMSGLASIDARVSCSVEGAGDIVAELTFFNAGDDGAIATIKMYRLPAADAALADHLKLAAGVQKSWPMPGGKPFDPNLFAPRSVPAHWRHKAVQTVSIGPGVVHAYRVGSRAMIVQFGLRRGDVTMHPLFRWVAQNLRVAGQVWHFDPPVPPPAYDDDDELTGPDDVGDAIGAGGGNDDDVVDLSQETSDVPLTATEQAQVAKNADRGREALGLPPGAPVNDVLNAIHEAVEQERPNFATYKPNVRHNLTVFVGSLWGRELCKATGWQWCALSHGDGGEGFLAIVSPDRAYAVSPVDFLISQLEYNDPDDGSENSVRLLYNMIVAGKLPPSKPGGYRMLS